MTVAMTGFICHDKYLEQTKKLSDEELGRLFRACMLYHKDGAEPDLDGRESMAFDFIKEDIDAAEKAHNEKCEVNRRNRLTAIEQRQNERQQTLTNDDERKETLSSDTNKIKVNKRNINKQNTNILFDRFWQSYPRHENKQAAMKAFEKAKVDDVLLNTILSAIERQKASTQWQENGGQFIPHPATWLNGHRWEDEVRNTKPIRTVTAQEYTQRDYSNEQNEAIQRMIAMEGA